MTEKRPIAVEDLQRLAYLEDPRISPDGRWLAYVLMQPDAMTNSYKRHIYLADLNSEARPIQLTRGGADFNPRWSPDSKQLAFVSVRGEEKKPQIYILRVDAPGGEARALTSAPNGAVSPEWSPDGLQIAYLAPMRADEREKEDDSENAPPPPADLLEGKHRKERQAEDEKALYDPRRVWRIPYRMGTAFLDERYAQIYVTSSAEVDPNASDKDKEAAKPRRLTDLDADHGFIQWSPDGASLYFMRTLQPEADEPFRYTGLWRLNLASGQQEALTGEDYASFVPLPSPDGQWLAYVRQRAAKLTQNQSSLAVINLADGSIHDLTLTIDREVEGFVWAKDSSVLYCAVADWGYTEIFSVDPSGGDFTPHVGGGLRVEAFDVSAEGGFAYVASTPQNPSEIFYQAPNSETSRAISRANEAFLSEIIIQEVHEMRYQAPDGHELHGWYILPVGYEEGKTYPLALNIHGGPHVMWTPGERTMFHEWQLHAARGYVVLATNPRGSAGYGAAHYGAIRQNWGELPMGDIMAGVDTLLEQGLVDPERMAVTGGSYGGYMTAWIVGHTDRFKAAVSQRGVYNLVNFYGTSDVPMLISSEFETEPWLDMPFLWQHSPIAYAQNITTPLLLIHSENDYRVPISEAEQFFAFVHRATDTPVSLWRYPRDGHEMSRSGELKHRIHRLTKMLDWFDQYCKTEA